MRTVRAGQVIFATLLAALSSVARAQTPQAGDSVFVIHAATLLDGRGGAMRDARILVRGRTIERVVSGRLTAPGAKVIELGNATLLPGMIDAHTHPGWYVDKQGKRNSGRSGDSPQEAFTARAGNLKATLLAGFTTIQSVGGTEDIALRAAVASDSIPGPRLLTSIRQLSNTRPTPDTLRAQVRALKAQGADLIKLFASAGLGTNMAPQLLSDEQIGAICSEAKAQGLRTLVHAITPQSVRAATLAGCTQIEHGSYATDAELTLMAEHGTIFDPQVCLVFQNYIDHPDMYGFDSTALAPMVAVLPVAQTMFQHALKTPGLKIVFGTDAVAGSHGRNADELVCRVKAGQKPMDAIISATSAAASALGMGDHLGVLAPGFDADIIATDGNPAVDISATKRVVFVMRAGHVYSARGR